MRRAITASMGLMAAACAGLPDTTPINHQLSFAPTPVIHDMGIEGDAIALAFSGGGARAASFSLGVLLQLREMKDTGGRPLLGRVTLIPAVSGGAITAAYFGQAGAEGLDNFRNAALDHDWQGQLHTSWMSPQNWDRLLQGGLNGPDKLSNWLDKNIFGGERMRDLNAKPQIIINATDLYTGAPFAFAQPWFEAICPEIGCTLPSKVDIAQIRSTNLVVRSHPQYMDALDRLLDLVEAGAARMRWRLRCRCRSRSARWLCRPSRKTARWPCPAGLIARW